MRIETVNLLRASPAWSGATPSPLTRLQPSSFGQGALRDPAVTRAPSALPGRLSGASLSSPAEERAGITPERRGAGTCSWLHLSPDCPQRVGHTAGGVGVLAVWEAAFLGPPGRGCVLCWPLARVRLPCPRVLGCPDFSLILLLGGKR